jgi:hydroxymethylglutaryl-CoA synthase
MVGIRSYGAYIPRYRIDRKIIYSAMGWLNPATYMAGEKAVANYDEDSISMAVNAGMNCLRGIDRNTIDGLYFGSVSLPYKVRQNAGIIATALDLRADITTADFTSSTKSGTTALIAACNAIKAGAANNILVCASDCRMAKPGSAQEQAYGDAAVAVLVGETDVVANFQGAYSVSYDFVDKWAADTDKFEHTWEDRWIRDEAYNKFIPESITGLAKKCNLNPQDAAKVCYPCLYLRDHADIGKRLGIKPNQVQAHMLDTLGDSGNAYSLILLVAALEDANSGDNIVAASFGDGSDVLLFQVTEKIAGANDGKKGIKEYLASKNNLASYEKYATFRDIFPVEKGIRGESVPWEQKTLAWRYRRGLLALVGSKCKKCGTPQFPAQRVCVNPDCKAIDQMDDYRFSDKNGRLFTYTEDSLAFSISPPAMYGKIHFEGGGSSLFDLTDCESGSLRVDMPVEMSFRRKFADPARGTYSYFWKAVPI